MCPHPDFRSSVAVKYYFFINFTFITFLFLNVSISIYVPYGQPQVHNSRRNIFRIILLEFFVKNVIYLVLL